MKLSTLLNLLSTSTSSRLSELPYEIHDLFIALLNLVLLYSLAI